MKKKSLRAILCFSLWKKAPDLLTIRRERLANTQENKLLMGIYPKIGIDWINVQGLVEIRIMLFIEVTVLCFRFVTKAMLLPQKCFGCW